jgi:outer membrane protein
MIRNLPLLAAIGLATPALAQTGPAAPALPSVQEVADKDTLTIAGGVGYRPDYEGSDDYHFIPAAAVRGKYRGISFSTRAT